MAELKFGDIYPDHQESIIEQPDDGSLSSVIADTLTELRQLGILPIENIAARLDVPVAEVVKATLTTNNPVPVRRDRPMDQSA